MKNLFSLLLVAFATLSFACGGNTTKTAETAEEATEEVVINEEECCAEECDECTEECCDKAEVEKEAEA